MGRPEWHSKSLWILEVSYHLWDLNLCITCCCSAGLNNSLFISKQKVIVQYMTERSKLLYLGSVHYLWPGRGGGGGGKIDRRKIKRPTRWEYTGKKSPPPPMTLLEKFAPPPPPPSLFKTNMPLCCCCAPTTVIIHVMSLSWKKS